ncbi:MAG: NAD(+) synthase [Chloroflexi bacterium]|nr:NAD(+) synthase [Chloroflexota bacterium]
MRGLGMVRLAAGVPEVRVADVAANARAMITLARKARRQGVQVLAFPEMALTGYTIGDLVLQKALMVSVRDGIGEIAEATAGTNMVVVFGAPLEIGDRAFNCAVVVNAGRVLGVIPKTYLPSYREFYETRWFASGMEPGTDSIELCGDRVPFGPDLLFSLRGMPGAVIGVEICEDLWVPLAPHEHQAIAGATLLVNISASNEVIAKADWRRAMVVSESGRCMAAFCYVSNGPGESTIDVVFGGHTMIAENGIMLHESGRLSEPVELAIADVDLEKLVHDRRLTSSFRDAPRPQPAPRMIEAVIHDPPAGRLHRLIDPHPFVPADPWSRAKRCREIFAMQVGALAGKLRGANIEKVVIGTSGGLDSTLALITTVKTMDHLGLPRKNVHAFSMPGFGTSGRTRTNATKLCEALGVTFEEVDITRASKVHLRDLKHAGEEDRVFENVQARYRTEFLFNKANALGGILLGTGDLTEVALGWCTFSGDQLSHYHINISVPKTLVQYLIRWAADEEMVSTPAQAVLYDVLGTPISPELLRGKRGQIIQETEKLIGPVELLDFYLYPFIRWGTRPGKILYFANQVRELGGFGGKYTLEDLHRWLRLFIERFFANQFKRTCMPEGPKIGSVSLSPRGDWRMPSEASAKAWLDDLEAMLRALRAR